MARRHRPLGLEGLHAARPHAMPGAAAQASQPRGATRFWRRAPWLTGFDACL
ncbi:hypothetical protein TIFTF001_016984 [Ficus carica]|uniref:Uncharacterized protein n=1 Tax=Ficus carica TaxID=3494 RepID=A0AA88A8P8_FICCA|nr:hypothetical protein TIFTF001_016984 [Ficus carica]